LLKMRLGFERRHSGQLYPAQYGDLHKPGFINQITRRGRMKRPLGPVINYHGGLRIHRIDIDLQNVVGTYDRFTVGRDLNRDRPVTFRNILKVTQAFRGSAGTNRARGEYREKKKTDFFHKTINIESSFPERLPARTM